MKINLKSKTDAGLLGILIKSDPLEDAELLTECKAEIRRREESEDYNGYYQNYRDQEAEDSIKNGEINNPLKSYYCPSCKCESVLYVKEQKIKRCLICRKPFKED